MKKRILLFPLSAILVLSFLPAQAQRTPPHALPGGGANSQARTVTVQGFVRLAENDQPIDHVRVELHHLGAGSIAESFTGARGEFSFPQISGGEYQLVVEEDGYEPVHQELQLSDSMAGNGIVLFLHRLAAVGAKAPSGMVSARQLGLPERVQKDFNAGLAELFDKHKPEASLPLFARVITKAPAFYEAYHYTGVAYQKLGRNAEAETALRKSIELSAGHFAESQITLASVLVTESKFNEAEAAAREGLGIAPENWAANYELARALMGLERLEDAEKSIRETLKAKPDLADAYLLLANIHMNRKNDLSLINDLDNFLRIVPQGPQSDKAREMRDRTMKDMAEAKAGSTPATPPR